MTLTRAKYITAGGLDVEALHSVSMSRAGLSRSLRSPNYALAAGVSRPSKSFVCFEENDAMPSHSGSRVGTSENGMGERRKARAWSRAGDEFPVVTGLKDIG